MQSLPLSMYPMARLLLEDCETNLRLLELCDAILAYKHGGATDAHHFLLEAACVAAKMARRESGEVI